MRKSKNSQNEQFLCEYCKKVFKKENTLQTHMCEKKRRVLNKTDKSSVLAFNIYQYWYKMAMGRKKDKTYEEFALSKFYNIFVKFAHYVENSNIHDWQQYILWTIKNSIKIDDWAKDSTYYKYIKDNTKKETPERAIEKYILYVKVWSERTGNEWDEYFLKSNPESIIEDIISGKISPWILYCSNSAQQFVDELPDELVVKLIKEVDFDFWASKVKQNREDCEWIKSLIP